MARTRRKGGYFKTQFTVTGSTRFPLDMLRYDQCAPARSEDVYKMLEYWEGGYVRGSAISVNLYMYKPELSQGPTRERWASYGWTVTEWKEAPQP